MGINCTDDDIRLMGTYNVIEIAGCVELCVKGEWRAACNLNWDANEITVVCQQLGFPQGGKFT